jgi:hypothetical protein
MNKILFIAFTWLSLSACNSKWEYKLVTVKGKEDEVLSKFQSNKFEVTDESLNLLGEDGWELVSVYDQIETVHPNYGNDQYVSGLQPNVRTAEIHYVFKRKKK